MDRNRKHRRALALVCSAVLALASLAGCGSSAGDEEVAALNARISELEQENAYLEGRLDAMEGSPRADRQAAGTEDAAETGTGSGTGAETGTGTGTAESAQTAGDTVAGSESTAGAGSTAEPNPNARAQGPWQPPDGVTLNPTNPNGSFREQHGALHVEGASLVDQNGDPIQLYGMSTHGVAWFPEYVNNEAVRTLRDDWGANCFRIALYPDESGGYASGGNAQELYNCVINGVNHATNNGIYVIVDWHVLGEGNPLLHQDEAIEFFRSISSQYANYTNILYEICNEPNGSATWSDVKAYADAVIPVIRANDPDAVILVGTPTWSQDIDKALADPLPYDNILYTLHFYAATHKDELRDRLKACVDAGLPVFVTEFGICDASGDGALDLDSATKWLELLDSYQISYINWNLSNKKESAAAIAPSCKKTSDWSESELSESGKWVRAWFRGRS